MAAVYRLRGGCLVWRGAVACLDWTMRCGGSGVMSGVVGRRLVPLCSSAELCLPKSCAKSSELQHAAVAYQQNLCG
jgi:hypothetical protein